MDHFSEIFGFYGALENEKLVGMISLQPFENGKAQIFTLYVDPAHRKKGVGSSLLAHALLRASQFSIPSIKLTVIAGNPAIPMYEALGFKRTHENKGALRNDNGVFDELVFQRELS